MIRVLGYICFVLLLISSIYNINTENGLHYLAETALFWIALHPYTLEI